MKKEISLNTKVSDLKLSIRLSNVLKRNNMHYLKDVLKVIDEKGMKYLKKRWLGLGNQSSMELISLYHAYKHLLTKKQLLTGKERAIIYRQLASNLERRESQRTRLRVLKGYSNKIDNPVLESNLLDSSAKIRQLRRKVASCYKRFHR